MVEIKPPLMKLVRTRTSKKRKPLRIRPNTLLLINMKLLKSGVSFLLYSESTFWLAWVVSKQTGAYCSSRDNFYKARFRLWILFILPHIF